MGWRGAPPPRQRPYLQIHSRRNAGFFAPAPHSRGPKRRARGKPLILCPDARNALPRAQVAACRRFTPHRLPKSGRAVVTADSAVRLPRHPARRTADDTTAAPHPHPARFRLIHSKGLFRNDHPVAGRYAITRLVVILAAVAWWPWLLARWRFRASCWPGTRTGPCRSTAAQVSELSGVHQRQPWTINRHALATALQSHQWLDQGRTMGLRKCCISISSATQANL